MADSNQPKAGEVLCELVDLQATGARGIDRDDPPFAILVARFENGVKGYVNSCPHRGTPLEMFPDRFLDETGEELICATHGARFRVVDGVCTSGPCRGARLTPVSLKLRGKFVVMDTGD